MFARSVCIKLKPNMLFDYTRILNNYVWPLLRKQPGFKEEITFVDPGNILLTAISLWDSRVNAEAYEADVFQEVLRNLARVIDGTPMVTSGEVANSTLRQMTTLAAA
jgi:hypothetical protein